MKIAFLTTDNREQHQRYDLPAPYFGTAMEALLQGFALLPHEVEIHVISCSKQAIQKPVKLAENIWFHQPVVPKLGWGRTFFLGCARAVRSALGEIGPDLVHGQGTERDCSVSAVLSGYENVLTIHGNMRVHAGRPESKGSLYYKMAAFLEGVCLRKTNGVVAISSYTDALVKPIASQTWLLPNAADLRFFEVESRFPQMPRLLFVGSLGERKNALGLIRACEPMLRANACTLAIAGDGHPADSYVAEVKRCASSIPGIEVLGFIGRDALAVELARSSLLVLPTYEDNCPMVVLEAMAAGLPVAASCVGGIPDLIQDMVTGRLFAPDDHQEMREAIQSIIFDRSNAERYGSCSREHAFEHYHPKVVAQAHLEIYREVIASRKGF